MPPKCFHMMEDLSNADKIIRRAIMSCHPRDWDEDFITRTWLRELRNNLPKLNFPNGNRIRAVWDAFKINGQLEQDNGDVAFIVKITFKNNNELTGVGFLEAKRIYENSHRYDALKWAQLKNMVNNSSSHHLLLYDYEEQEILSSSLHCDYGMCPYCHYFELHNKAIGVVVPTAQALAYEIKDRNLTKIGYRLSEQILHRYFNGLDLNFDQEIVNSVLSGAKGGIAFLAIAHVILDEETETQLSPDNILISESSVFSRISREPTKNG